MSYIHLNWDGCVDFGILESLILWISSKDFFGSLFLNEN